MDTSIPFHTLVKVVDSEDITNETILSQEQSLHINTEHQNWSLKFCFMRILIKTIKRCSHNRMIRRTKVNFNFKSPASFVEKTINLF